MKVWIVSSQVTFIPKNYIQVLEGVVDLEQVKGLIILKNRSFPILLKGLFLWASRLASGIGLALIKNYFSCAKDPRKKLFLDANKKVQYFKTVNCKDFREFILQEEIDVLLNARTRDIYKRETLMLPKKICLNIHHGLLPDQRGVFCDLWALSEGNEAGFSVHEMTEKLDAGRIIEVKVVAPKHSKFKTYMDYQKFSTVEESRALRNILSNIDKFLNESKPNQKTAHTKYFKNPKLKDLIDFKLKGFIA